MRDSKCVSYPQSYAMLAHAQLALAAKVGEDRGLADTQALRDLGGGGAFIAALGEHLAPHAHDVAHPLFGLGAGRLAALHALGGARGVGAGSHRDGSNSEACFEYGSEMA